MENSRMSDEMNREELVSAMEERRREIEQEFRPENMKIVRKELFASLRDPAVTIRNGNITSILPASTAWRMLFGSSSGSMKS